MLSNRLAFVALAIACIGAAAGGGYLATRQNTVPTPASAQTTTAMPIAPQPSAQPPATQAGAVEAPTKPVQETEAVVGDAARRAPAVAPKPSAGKTVEPPARRAVAPASHPPAAHVVAHQQPVPAPTTSAASQPVTAPLPGVDAPPAGPRLEDRGAPEPVRVPEPPARAFEELVVSADSVIGFQTETRVSSETARVEDRVDGRVTRDVRVGDRVAIPAGTRIIGSVMQVDRGGKIKERAHLGIRFHTLVLADGSRVPISTETISRDGEAPRASSSQKIGGAAVGGAILGAILGGGKGMAIGAGVGAGAGAAAVAASDRNAATLPAGTSMTVRILQPITIATDGK